MALPPLAAAEVLAVWERASGRRPLDRAAAMLAAVGEQASEVAALPIGERDRRLWELREAAFGPDIEALADCPACARRVEFQFTVPEVRAPAVGPLAGEHELRDDKWLVRFRLPVGDDLAVIAGERDAARARMRLAARCLLYAARDGAETPADQMPDGIWKAVEQRMSDLDPQAEVRFEMSCPWCQHGWAALFDIAQFLWEEIAALALRLLRQVDILARAYGWSEADILRLSPGRRQVYLELAGA